MMPINYSGSHILVYLDRSFLFWAFTILAICCVFPGTVNASNIDRSSHAIKCSVFDAVYKPNKSALDKGEGYTMEVTEPYDALETRFTGNQYNVTYIKNNKKQYTLRLLDEYRSMLGSPKAKTTLQTKKNYILKSIESDRFALTKDWSSKGLGKRNHTPYAIVFTNLRRRLEGLDYKYIDSDVIKVFTQEPKKIEIFNFPEVWLFDHCK